MRICIHMEELRYVCLVWSKTLIIENYISETWDYGKTNVKTILRLHICIRR
jgi:hypothetical protein